MQCLPSQFLCLLLQGQTGPRMHDLSPEPVVHLSQHKLLPLMLHRAHRRGGRDSIRFGHQLQCFQQSPDGVTCTVQPSQVFTCSLFMKVLQHRLTVVYQVRSNPDSVRQHALTLNFASAGHPLTK